MTRPVRALLSPHTDGDPLAETQTPTVIGRFLEAAEAGLQAARGELHRLDAVFGDGDHGDAVVAGFSAAYRALDSAPDGLGPTLQHAAQALADTMGGAAGPLYGTVLRSLALEIGAASELRLTDVAAGLRRAADEVARRGRVSEGDGTLLDALEPAAVVLEQQVACDGRLGQALGAAVAAADSGAAATTNRPKRRGRASNHPSQGVGTQDPGAKSFAIVIRALADAVTETHPCKQLLHEPREAKS